MIIIVCPCDREYLDSKAFNGNVLEEIYVFLSTVVVVVVVVVVMMMMMMMMMMSVMMAGGVEGSLVDDL